MRQSVALISALVIGVLCLPPLEAKAGEITDVAGRAVVIDKPAERVVLSSANYIEAVAIMDPDNPVRRIVGIAQGPAGLDPSIQRQLEEKWPEAKSIPLFGGRGAESVSVEKIITLKPDVAIFGVADHGPGSKATELISQLEKAGVKIVFIDFRMNPLKNTVPSMKVLGEVFGRQERAKAYIDYYRSGLNLIRERIAKLDTPRPKVFLQAHVGRMACCVAMAKGMLGPMVELAGGENVSASVSPGPIGRHTEEFLISQQIDVFIGTASGQPVDFEAGKKMIVLGGTVTPDMARASFDRATNTAALMALPAWEAGSVHGIWHGFYNSPFNLYAALKFAKWIRPEAFKDVDPDAMLAEMYSKFTPFRLTGTYAVSLKQPSQ